MLQGGCLNRLDLFLSEYMVGQSKMYGNFIVRNAMDNLKCMYFDTLNANVNRLRAREWLSTVFKCESLSQIESHTN